MREFDRVWLAIVLVCLWHQFSEALASRIPLNARPRVAPRLLATVEPRNLGSMRQGKAFLSKSIRKIPMFSSASDAVSGVGATPMQGLLTTLRGGGIAIGGVAKSILDDIGASKTKSWAVLVAAILTETVASTLMKKARDSSNLSLFLFSICLNLISLCGFCTALAKLDVGVAYAVWAALGTVIVTAAGVVFFQEAMDPLKMVSMLLVVLGVVGLNLGEGH